MRTYTCQTWLRPALAAMAVLMIYGKLAKAADAPPTPPQAINYAGTFSDGKITVDLKPAALAKYIGSITMGENKFPLTAADNGRALEGSFESKGNAYAFTATLSADKLTFQTGRSTYTLARQGGDNPLDKPENPLDQGPTPPAPPAPPAPPTPPAPPPPPTPPPPPVTEQPPALVADWSGVMKGGGVVIPLTVSFRADGHYVLRTQRGVVQEGKWTATTDSLTMTPDDGVAERHPYELQSGVLTMAGATGSMRLTKVGG